MLFQKSMSITQQLTPIYNTTVHKNKRIVSVALNVVKCWCHETPICQNGDDEFRALL